MATPIVIMPLWAVLTMMVDLMNTTQAMRALMLTMTMTSMMLMTVLALKAHMPWISPLKL